MTKREKFKEYVKEHKKEIVIGTIATIGTGALVYLGIKPSKSNSDKSILAVALQNGIEDIDIHLDTATVTEAWTENGTTMMILNDFKCKDLGALGEDLIKNVPDITEDTVLSSIMGTTLKQ